MSTQQIRKRVEKIEETSAMQRNGVSPMVVALAEAFSPDELRAIERRWLAKPEAVAGEVLTPEELKAVEAQFTRIRSEGL